MRAYDDPREKKKRAKTKIKQMKYGIILSITISNLQSHVFFKKKHYCRKMVFWQCFSEICCCACTFLGVFLNEREGRMTMGKYKKSRDRTGLVLSYFLSFTCTAHLGKNRWRKEEERGTDDDDDQTNMGLA